MQIRRNSGNFSGQKSGVIVKGSERNYLYTQRP